VKLNTKKHVGCRSGTGATLIIVLALVTVVTILLLAYLTTAQMERSGTQSYSGGVSAHQIALGGLDRATADLIQEIKAGSTANPDPNNNAGAPVYYKPITNLTMVPARYTDSSTAAYTNLIRVSTGVIANYNAAYPSTSYTASQVPTDLAITSSTLTPSLDGRFISTSRWAEPQLLLPTETMPSPDWILVTRNGPTNAAGLAGAYFGSSGNTLNNPVQSNPNYVVGRYAYVIYNEGGLIDATVAGVPSTAAGVPNVASADDIANRGSLAMAMLTNSVLTAAQLNALSTWRNASAQTTNTANSESTYTNYVYNTQTTNGFLQVQPGDNTYLSRQDLIAFARQSTPSLTNALP
jgi:Tfp pilus assembly protein PilX